MTFGAYMIDEIIFGNITLPGEMVRLFIAFAGTAITAYYDIFNKRNIPDRLLCAFLGIALLTNIIFYDEQLLIFSVALAVFVSAIGYLFYRAGQLGGADVFVMVSIILLLPIQPSFVSTPFNIPFFFPVWLFAGISLALFVLVYFGWKLAKMNAKPNLTYGLLIIAYLVFAYVYVNSVLFSLVYFAFLSVALITTVFFLMFKQDLNRLLAEKVPLSMVEAEDVVAQDLMDPETVKKYSVKRLMTADDIKRLKKMKLKELWIYTRLPPFLPFILIGMALSLFYTNLLFLM